MHIYSKLKGEELEQAKARWVKEPEEMTKLTLDQQIEQTEKKLIELKWMKKREMFTSKEIDELVALFVGETIKIPLQIKINYEQVHIDYVNITVRWKYEDTAHAELYDPDPSEVVKPFVKDFYRCSKVKELISKMNEKISAYLDRFDEKHGAHNGEGINIWNALNEVARGGCE